MINPLHKEPFPNHSPELQTLLQFCNDHQDQQSLDVYPYRHVKYTLQVHHLHQYKYNQPSQSFLSILLPSVPKKT